MNHLNERVKSALDLFLRGCRHWAEVQNNERFLRESKNIKEEFKRVSRQTFNEETVALIEKMTFRILSELDLTIKNMGLKGLQIEGTRH